MKLCRVPKISDSNPILHIKSRLVYVHSDSKVGLTEKPFGDEVVICVPVYNDVANRQLHLKQTFAAQRAQGLPDLPMVLLMNFVDALHFASSSESIGLQLADVAAFVIKRHSLMRKGQTDKLYKYKQLNDQSAIPKARCGQDLKP